MPGWTLCQSTGESSGASWLRNGFSINLQGTRAKYKKSDKLLMVSTPAAFHKDKLVLTWNIHWFPQVPPEDFGASCKQAYRSWASELSCVQTPLWTPDVTAMIAALEAARTTKIKIYSKERAQKGRKVCKMHMPVVRTRLLHSCPSRVWWEVFIVFIVF